MSINTWLGRAAGNTHDGEQEQDHKDIGGCTLNHDHTGHDHSSRHSSQASRVGGLLGVCIMFQKNRLPKSWLQV